MAIDRRARREICLALALAALVRLPFWIEASRTPLDGDSAIVGLMARHAEWSTTFWGQPYGSPLEAWLAMPLVFLLGSRALALHLLYFALGLALVPLAYALARLLDQRAAFPAALLVAVPPAYLLVISALPPPLYPGALLLCGLLLIGALRLRARLLAGEPALALAAGWGALAGLALWTHLMCISAVVPGLVALAPVLRRRLGGSMVLAVGMLLASAPLLVSQAFGGIFRVVRPAHAGAPWHDHFFGMLSELHRPLGVLLGAAVPVLADLRTRIDAPAWVGLCLGLLWAALVLSGAVAVRHSTAGRVLLGSALLALFVFLIPARSAAHTIRFLTPLYLPLAALAGAAIARRRWARFALALVAALHLAGASQLHDAWRPAQGRSSPLAVPDLVPVARLLESRGVFHAYASYDAAYRLTWESGESIMVSEPWNERFPGHPLPYFDDVQQASRLAWILRPADGSELPSPRAFERELRRIGARWRRTEVGGAFVYHDFALGTPAPTAAEPAGPRGGFELSWARSQPRPAPGTPDRALRRRAAKSRHTRGAMLEPRQR